MHQRIKRFNRQRRRDMAYSHDPQAPYGLREREEVPTPTPAPTLSIEQMSQQLSEDPVMRDWVRTDLLVGWMGKGPR